MLFGSATLLFRNPIFIQWKLTIVNWIFAFTLIITHLLGKKPIKGLVQMSGAFPDLPENAWKNVTYIWVVAVSLIGFTNLYFVFYLIFLKFLQFSLYFWLRDGHCPAPPSLMGQPGNGQETYRNYGFTKCFHGLRASRAPQNDKFTKVL